MYSTTKQWRTGTSVYSRLALWHGDHNIKFKISVRISWFDRIVRGVMTDLKSTARPLFNSIALFYLFASLGSLLWKYLILKKLRRVLHND